MSVSNPSTPLDAATARALPASAEIVVMSRADGTEIERLRLLRYAGHYRADAIHAFAVRDSEDKFHVRSERQLGLTADSPYVAYLLNAETALDEVDVRAVDASNVA